MQFQSYRRLAVALTVGAAIGLFATSASAAPEHLGGEANLDVWVEANRVGLTNYWLFHSITTKQSFSPPGVTWVNELGGTDTACGLQQVSDAVANGSFYCDKDAIVYLEKTRLLENDAQWGIAGILSSMAHEWGHHMQQQRGLLNNGKLTPKQTELQADCMSGAYMHYVRYGNDKQGTLDHFADVSTLMQRYYAIGDPPPPAGYSWAEPHGSPAERQSAFARGWNLMNTPYECTTWRP